MSDVSLDFMYQIGMTTDRLNDWGNALQKFGLSTEEAVARINSVMETVSSGAGIGATLRSVFAEQLRQFEEGSEE